MIRAKRVYEPPQRSDGARVLVDRLWPRGVAKDRAKVDVWLKEIAPSDGLRKWFGHEPAKWATFRRKYRAELKEKSELLQMIRRLERERGSVTLVYAASDTSHNNAVVLAQLLTSRRRSSQTG